MNSVQLAVVGGGPGGYAAAFLAADLGLSVALVDPEANPGGVGLSRLHSLEALLTSQVLDEADARRRGVEFGEPKRSREARASRTMYQAAYRGTAV